MTPNDFVYWLQGYVELSGDVPTEQQWEVIKDHLQLVMDKKTPVRSTNVEFRLSDLLKQDTKLPMSEQIKVTC